MKLITEHEAREVRNKLGDIISANGNSQKIFENRSDALLRASHFAIKDYAEAVKNVEHAMKSVHGELGEKADKAIEMLLEIEE